MNPIKFQIYVVSALFLFSLCGLTINYVEAQTAKEPIQLTVIEVTKPQQEIPAVQKTIEKPSQEVAKNVVPVQAKKQTGTNKATVKEHIIKYSIDMDMDPALALAIAKIESNFDHSKRSAYGAVGVFQMLPSTARSLGYDAYTQHENIKGGITYYKKMYQKFGSMDLALAAYNAGPGNVSRYKGVPPFAETQRFINKIKAEYENQKNEPLIEKYQNREM